VTVSYLGREEFAPAGARQAVLEERWGFRCGCERCRVEAAAPEALVRVVDELYARVMQVRLLTSWGVGGRGGDGSSGALRHFLLPATSPHHDTNHQNTQDLRPAFLEAVQSGDDAQLAAAARGLRDVDAAARAAIKQYTSPSDGDGDGDGDKAAAAELHPATATFMQAALYELHELQYAASQLDALGGTTESERAHAALASLSRCLSLVDTVSRGAELHVFLACALLDRATELRGADAPAALAALELARQAGEARYGRHLGSGLWEELQKANAELAGEYL
jgi:hypothetical protein